MFKHDCPCCKETMSLKEYANKLASFDILYEGYSCPNCKKKLLSKKIGWLLTLLYYIFFPILTFESSRDWYYSYFNNVFYEIGFIFLYMFTITYISWFLITRICQKNN